MLYVRPDQFQNTYSEVLNTYSGSVCFQTLVVTSYTNMIMVNVVSSTSQSIAWLKLGIYRLSVVLNTYSGLICFQTLVVTPYTNMGMVNVVSSTSQSSDWLKLSI